MEPISLITTALALATPFLIKTGEKIAENIGEGIWNLLKKPFLKNNEIDSNIDIKNEDEKEKLIQLLLARMNEDISFKEELESAVLKGKKDLNAYYQQNINNNGQIEKQVNIQNLTGNINF
jgi:hypothetical protein